MILGSDWGMHLRRGRAGCLGLLGTLLLLGCASGCTEGPGGSDLLPDDSGGSGTPDELPEGLVDYRRDFELPEGDNYLVVELPDLLVPAGEEHYFCLFGAWDGPEMTIVSLFPYHSPEFFHHGLLKAPREAEQGEDQEGEILDCTSQQGYWGNPVLVEYVGNEPGDPEDWINLPPGIGYRLASGQRYYGDVHYVNTSPDPILVNAAFVLELMPASDTNEYVGAFNHDAPEVMVPPGSEHHVQSDCTWESDVSILTLAGHMHAQGSAYAVDWTHSDGSERVYEVTEWQPDYQFGAPTRDWAIGEFEVRAGDTFTSHCTWTNSTDHTLNWGEEMCTTFGVAYPVPESLHCIGTDSTPPPSD
ncbi:MAG: hypothetical protein VX498_10855 [Myxococcota bacterium]|nr:hypothetical protein [Myxococcota bacterium]